MTVLVHDLHGIEMTRARVRGGLTPEIFRDLSSVEALWRAIETDPGVLATPYQRFDWVSAYVRSDLEAAPPGEAASLRIVVLRDESGRPRVLLPLEVSREGGVNVARVIGDKHANYHLPIFASREAAAMRSEDLTELLRAMGTDAGIDVYVLSHQPRFWDGAANPLSVRAEPAASDAYGLSLGPDPESTVRRVFSGDARKKLRAKEKKLVEAFGPVAYRRASTPAEIDSYLDAFYVQKAVRFAELGIANPYADERMRRFLAAAMRGDTVGEHGAATEIHALLACDSGRIFATFAGAVDDVRFSGMMTSFDQDPVVSRSSPGDLLLHHLIRDQAAQGRRAFDLGVGEARYKASICDETIALGEVVVPVTVRGQIFAMQTLGMARLKRRIKRSPRLWAMVQGLRRRRASSVDNQNP